MYCTDILKLSLFLPFLGLAAPDTTKIPARWKHEPIIVLDHVYRADESTFDDASYKEYEKTVYYIRDKYGLNLLSTFNIKTYIVPGAEMQIGKIYKRDGTIIELSTKHLVPLYTKIDFNNRKKSWSSYEADEDQKLAIPSLEVGDILEMEYYTNRKSDITYLDLSVDFPTLHSESFISVIAMSPDLEYTVNVQYKPVNFSDGKIETTDETLTIDRYYVERKVNESLCDEKKAFPHLVIWKKYIDSDGNDAFPKYTTAGGKVRKSLQDELVNRIFVLGVVEKKCVKVLTKLMDKEYPKIKDTVAYLNKLFYYFRELKALKSLRNNYNPNDIVSDEYFVNVVSALLYKKKIPHRVFITQEEYYGAPDSEREILNPVQGLYIETFNYYLFNPFLCIFPNQVPSYFEGQHFISFDANKYYYWGRKTKYLKYGFFPGTFPRSTSDENQTRTEVFVKEIDSKKQTCLIESKIFFWGKNKNLRTKNIYSSTFVYELTDNPYRQAIKKYYPKKVADAEVSAADRGGYLRDIILDGLRDDGYYPVKLNAYAVAETNFFETTKPIITSCEFEATDCIFAYDNYISVNIGKMTGNQLLYDPRDSPRLNDFFIPYKKKFTCTIKIKIPESYSAENIADLNFIFKSPAGKFESKAVIKGNMIEIETEKEYNFIVYSKENEKDVKGFMSLATEFTQKKLLFKKL